MARNLTAVAIRKSEDGKLFDGEGLSLDKRGESGKWVWRFQRQKRRREMGLGSWPAVSLADARKERDRWAAVLASGRDPIEEREALRQAELEARSKVDPTLEEAVMLVFEAKRDGLRGDGTRGRWLSPLKTHLLPKLGQRRLSEITKTDLHSAIKPIWRTKHPTAIKVVHRTRIVFRHMKLAGFDCDPFTVDAAEHMLGEVIHKSTPTPSTDWREIPALWERLSRVSIADGCLRFMLLTIVRLDGCAGARFSEIEGDVWTVPADRIKGREGVVEDFRVPLSPEALEVVEELRPFAESDLIFATRAGTPIGSREVERRLAALGEAGRPHGFRSSFRSWVQDTGSCAWEVSETVLGHAIGSKVERSYARSDLLDRRRPVMSAWARFVTGAATADVVPIRRK